MPPWNAWKQIYLRSPVLDAGGKPEDPEKTFIYYLIHTQYQQYISVINKIFYQLKNVNNITNKIHANESILGDILVRESTITFAQRYTECHCTKIMHICYLGIFWVPVSSIQIGCCMHVVHTECMNMYECFIDILF